MASDFVFQKAMLQVFAFEGGYVNDPQDPGGETKYGISKRAFPDVDIAALTPDQASEIYRTEYWLHPHLDRLPDGVAGAVFVLGINVGVRVAVRLLQEALEDVGRPAGVDGLVGPRTIAACNLAPTPGVLAALRWKAVLHYLAIVEAKPSMMRYRDGWLRRACSLV